MSVYRSNRQWDSKFGHNYTRWGAEASGIPSKKQLWLLDVPVGLSFGNMVVANGVCYYIADNYNIYAANSDNGKILWTYQNKDHVSQYTNISLGDSFVVFEYLVLDATTGKLIVDLRDQCSAPPIMPGDITTNRNHLIRVWNSKLKPGVNIDFDVYAKKMTFFSREIFAVRLSSDRKTHVGWKPSVNGHILAALTFPDGELKWSTNKIILGQIFLVDKYVVVINKLSILVLDLDSGSVIWEKTYSEISQDIVPSEISSNANFTLVCTDSIHIIQQNDRIISISLTDGALLWDKQSKNLQDACIAGDLIFAIQDEYELFALDRYSGEKVWEVTEHMSWGAVKSCDDKIFYIAVSGYIACYQWSNIYHSPAAPS